MSAGQAGGHVRRIQGQEFTLFDRWAGYEIPIRLPIKDATAKETLKIALWTLICRLHPLEDQPAVWFL